MTLRKRENGRDSTSCFPLPSGLSTTLTCCFDRPIIFLLAYAFLLLSSSYFPLLGSDRQRASICFISDWTHTDRQTDRQTDRRSREEDTGLQMLCNSPQLFNNYIIKHISSATKTHWPSFESDRKFGLPSYRIGHAFQSVGRHDFRTLGAGGHILWT